VAIEPNRTQLRLPAPEEKRASRQQNCKPSANALARAEHGQRKLRRTSAGAGSGGRGSGAQRARAASCACAYSMREQRPRADRSWAIKRGGRPFWGAHLWMVGWYPWALKRLVTNWIAGWMALPAF